MRLTPLRPLFGVEVHEVDLRTLDRTAGYPEIRGAFEEHSLLLFRAQSLLMAFVTRPELVYTHRWRSGDVLIWDERATVHRGRPWPYEDERTLASICISAGEMDGLAGVRPA